MRIKILTLFAMLCIAASAYAVTLPKVWVASETIKAADLNANFNALNAANDDHDELDNLHYDQAEHLGFARANGLMSQPLNAAYYAFQEGMLAHLIATSTLPDDGYSIPPFTHYILTATDTYPILYISQASATVSTENPVMTTASAPSGLAFGTGGTPYYAFDEGVSGTFGSFTTYWSPGFEPRVASAAYIGYKFAASTTVNLVSIAVGSGSAYSIDDFVVQASNDDITYFNIKTVTDAALPGQTNSLFQKYYVKVTNTTAYQYWRLKITGHPYGGTEYAYKLPRIYDLRFISNYYELIPLVPPYYESGVTTVATFPYEFGVSSWTLTVTKGLVTGITPP